MTRLILRRMLRAVAALLVVTAVVFTLLHASGDPAYILLTPEATAEDRAAFRHEYGLDRPLWVQYTRYLAQLAHGNLGVSFSQRRPVSAALADAIPNTIVLAGTALLIDFGLGLLLGVEIGRAHV